MSTVQSPAESVVKAPELSRRRWGIIFILLLAAVVNYLDVYRRAGDVVGSDLPDGVC